VTRCTDLTDVSRSIEHSYCIIVPVSSQKDAPLYCSDQTNISLFVKKQLRHASSACGGVTVRLMARVQAINIKCMSVAVSSTVAAVVPYSVEKMAVRVLIASTTYRTTHHHAKTKLSNTHTRTTCANCHELSTAVCSSTHSSIFTPATLKATTLNIAIEQHYTFVLRLYMRTLHAHANNSTVTTLYTLTQSTEL
jgi:hypothetical protein